MSDQTKLLSRLELLRDILGQPSTLPKDTLEGAKIHAQNLADRCWFNAGWHAANPDKQLKGSASTEELTKVLGEVIGFLSPNVRPRRGKGRPAAESLDPDYIPVLVVICLAGLEDDAGGKRYVVNQALENGLLKDKQKIVNGERKTTSTAAHLKKVDRELNKLAKRRAKRERAATNNILIFRPKKVGKTKNPAN